MRVSRNRVMVCILVILCGLYHSLYAKGENLIGSLKSEAKQGLYTSVDTILSDLQDFLPGYMKDKHIPGCAISLIYDHRIAWSGGFGYLNSITRKAVEGESVFEVASNSKIVASCVALLLVEQGKLALDTSLNSYLEEPWLPDTTYREVITLRHVLTHSSGLGHNSMGREVLFPPGTDYHYSNLGFTYLQHVIEELSGESLEELASTLVFEPMGMSSTSYTNPKRLRPKLANGHVPGTYLLGLSGILFLVSLLGLWVPGLLIHRFTRKQWLPKKRTMINGLLLTVVLWLVITFIFFRMAGWIKYAWQIAFFGLVFISLSMLLFLAGRALFRLLKFPINIKTSILLSIWLLAIVSGLVFISKGMNNIPVPKWPAIRPMAPASLRTSAPDISKFLLEISKAGHRGIPISKQMLDPQVRLHPEISWGLGMGIFHSPQGDALWQWGQNVDFLSLVIYWPEKGFGMVVLTNSEWGEPDVAIEIAQQALRLNLESVIKASHLEFSGELSFDSP